MSESLEGQPPSLITNLPEQGDYQIIKITQKNIPQYVEAIVAIERASFALPWSKETYLAEMFNPKATYLGLVQGETLLGYAGYWLIFDEGDINNVAIHPDYRGLGLGKKLMQALIENCKKQGGKQMTLEVRESNQIAIAMYQGLGFVSAGVRTNYYEDNREGADIMWLDCQG